ncbi:MAG: hypothetical protein Q9221_008586 [Calogaya cf. arnoldii]
MPLYSVQHTTPLSPYQKDLLAFAITCVHTEQFNTPKLFVHVQFEQQKSAETYIAGKKHATNRILAHIRPGASRSKEDFHELCVRLRGSWDQIVEGKGKLDAIFILGDIVAGMEAGLMLPDAGMDSTWMAENKGEFEKRAAKGDRDMVALLKEMEETRDLNEHWHY